jgi:hypothetical protein
VEISPGYFVPPVGLGDEAATLEHKKRLVIVVPQKEPYFPPHIEVDVGINSVPRFDIDVHATQNDHFYA